MGNKLSTRTIEANVLCFIRNKKGVYRYELKTMNPKTKKMVYTFTNITSGNRIELCSDDFTQGNIITFFERLKPCTDMETGKMVMFDRKEKKYYYFYDEENKEYKKTFNDLLEDRVIKGYEEKKKMKLLEPKDTHKVPDFYHPVKGAKKYNFQKMKKEELKMLPEAEKMLAASKEVLFEKPDFNAIEDPQLRILKQKIWRTIPDEPSVCIGLHVPSSLDDYIEYVKTVWGEMTEPKQKYEEFNAIEWVNELADNLFLDTEYVPFMGIDVFEQFNVVKMSDLAEFMLPNKNAMAKAIDTFNANQQKERWKNNYRVLTYDLANDNKIALRRDPNGLPYISAKLGNGTGRYYLTSKQYEQLKKGLPEAGTVIVLDQRKCNNPDVPAVVAVDATTEEEGWNIAQRHSQNKPPRETKKTAIKIALDECDLQRLTLQIPDLRTGDVTGDQFGEKYRPWGTVFGSSQDDDIRQRYLNLTYDGLQDMALALDIPVTQDMMFEDTLSLGFASHGSGPVEAFYRPKNDNVLAFTNKRGYGHLGFLWWEAMDQIVGQRLGFGHSLSRAYLSSPDRLPEQIKDLFDFMLYGGKPSRNARSNYSQQCSYYSKHYIGDYNSLHMMFARAGSTYMLDKFIEKGMVNSFVNGKTYYIDNKGVEITPSGRERLVLFNYFDAFMDYVKANNLFRKQA